MDYKTFKLYLLNTENQVSRINIYEYSNEKQSDYLSEKDNELIDSGVDYSKNALNIYMDDSIENVKFKMTSTLKDKNFENYYFFHQIVKKILTKDFFYVLRNKDNLISGRKLSIFFQNASTTNSTIMELSTKVEEDSDYTLEELYGFIGEHNAFIFDVPLDITNDPKNPLFIVNPFKNGFNYSELQTVRKNSNLLFENGDIVEKTIYGVHVKEYSQYISARSILSIEDTLNAYYNSHFLANRTSFDGIDVTNREFVEKYEEYNLVVDYQNSFYEKHVEGRPSEVVTPNIHKIEFVHKPKTKVMFPLEIFFKKIQTGANIPFVKFNPGVRMENVYRLYCRGKDNFGNKVPMLSKKVVRKLKESIHRIKSVTCVFYPQPDETFVIDVNEIGELYCTVNTSNLRYDNISSLEKYIGDTMNQVLKLFIKYFDPTSRVYDFFASVKSENIDIIELKYRASIKQKLTASEFKDTFKYFPSIFSYLSDNGKEMLVYKRVSNYDKMAEVDAYITKALKKQIDMNYLVSLCAEIYFSNNKEKAVEKVQSFLNKSRADNHMKEGGEILRFNSSLSNPGFKFYIGDDGNIQIDLTLIDNFEYIEHILFCLNNFMAICLGKVDSKSVDKHFSFILDNIVINVILSTRKKKNYEL